MLAGDLHGERAGRQIAERAQLQQQALGRRARAGMRALARPFERRSIIGRVKDAVLPVPVWAMPRTS
jgi:hypothetical protein